MLLFRHQQHVPHLCMCSRRKVWHEQKVPCKLKAFAISSECPGHKTPISDLRSSMGPLCLVGWKLKVESCLSWIHHGYYSFVLNPVFLLESTFLAPVCFSPPFFFINPPLFLIKSSMFPWQKVLGLLVVWIPHLAKSGTSFLVQTINDCEAIPPCFLHEPYDTLAPPCLLVMLSKSFVLLGELPLFVGGL